MTDDIGAAPGSAAYYDALAARLGSALLADILDDLGVRTSVMRHTIRPLFDRAVAVGRAATMLAVDVYETPAEPYRHLMEGLDALEPGAVVVVTTNGSTRAALWGELLSTATASRGGRGAVLDGLARDARRIEAMGFPVFSTGLSPADSKGRCEVIAHGVTIEAGGVRVRPGDLVFGDRDGVVVVPQELEAEAVRRALRKASEENRVREALRGGMPVTEAFRRYGVL
ncbi:MAG TPA: RraA family protein [Thermodesulfobacteriota bacterium]